MNEIVVAAVIHDGVPDGIFDAVNLAKQLEESLVSVLAAHVKITIKNGAGVEGMAPQVYVGVRSYVR